ncbi:hypothetical protein GQ53DRAFT_527515 [Thozetella sp. PMI_491]|nr:hypothetical protein GQ53DRAFT_527515 [Thozetella sp. PMI_491]
MNGGAQRRRERRDQPHPPPPLLSLTLSLMVPRTDSSVHCSATPHLRSAEHTRLHNGAKRRPGANEKCCRDGHRPIFGPSSHEFDLYSADCAAAAPLDSGGGQAVGAAAAECVILDGLFLNVTAQQRCPRSPSEGDLGSPPICISGLQRRTRVVAPNCCVARIVSSPRRRAKVAILFPIKTVGAGELYVAANAARSPARQRYRLVCRSH